LATAAAVGSPRPAATVDSRWPPWLPSALRGPRLPSTRPCSLRAYIT